MRQAALLALLAFPIGCGQPVSELPVTCPGEGDYEYADVVVEAPGSVGSPSAINVPHNAVNGVHGDAKAGGLDVFSRGLSTTPPNNYVVLRWSHRVLADVEGPDFVVFENAFESPEGVFMDPIVVAVSADGEAWVEFPHDYAAENPEKYEADPTLWIGFGGITPVRYDSNDPTCPNPLDDGGGGDRFDLADLASFNGPARFVRLTAAPTVIDPETGKGFPRHPVSDGFDVDGIYAAATEAD